MNIISLSIQRPTAVIAMVLMIVLFGWVSLTKIPIQMAPDVRQPVIIIKTSWRGASPNEIERERHVTMRALSRWSFLQVSISIASYC